MADELSIDPMAPEMMTAGDEPAGPKQKPETPEVFKKIVDFCFEKFDDFSRSERRTAQIELIKEARAAYDQEEDEKTANWPFENAENITLPLTTITVDNMEPRLVAGLIGKEPVVRFEPLGAAERNDAIKIIEKWFDTELREKIKVQQFTRNTAHGILTEGTDFPLITYDLQEKKKKRNQVDPQTGQIVLGEDGLPVREEYMATVYDGAVVKSIPFEDVFIPDDIGTIAQWEECTKIIIVRPTYAELQRDKKKAGYIAENIGPHLLGEKTKDKDKVTGKEVIECIECRLSYPIYQDEELEEDEQVNFEEEKIIITIAKESKTVIRFLKQVDVCMENSSQLKRVRLFPEDGCSYGTPMYGKLKAVQTGGSNMFNMVANIAMLTMLPWFFYDRKSGLRGEIALKPGHGVEVDNVEGIKFPNFNINPGQFLEFMNIFTSLWERIGSIGDWQIGRTNEGGKKTATEVMSVLQEGNIKHNYQAEITKDEFLEVIRQIYDVTYENMNPETMVPYNDAEVLLPYAIMQRGMRFVLASSTEAANKYIDRKEKEDLMGMLGNDPMINPIKPREEMLKAYGITDTAQWINPQAKMLIDALLQNPEIMDVVGQYLQTKAQMQQVIEGGGDAGAAAPGRGVPGVQEKRDGGGSTNPPGAVRFGGKPGAGPRGNGPVA